jgi:hypothetical protein
MNVAIRSNSRDASTAKKSSLTALLILGLSFSPISSPAETALNSAVFFNPSAPDQGLTVDFWLPEPGSIRSVKVETNGQTINSSQVTFTPASNLSDFRSAILLVVEPAAKGKKSSAKNLATIKEWLPKSGPPVQQIGLATISKGKLELLTDVGVPALSKGVDQLNADQNLHLSYHNVNAAIDGLNKIPADERVLLKGIVVRSLGQAKESLAKFSASAGRLTIALTGLASPLDLRVTLETSTPKGATGPTYFLVNHIENIPSDPTPSPSTIPTETPRSSVQVTTPTPETTVESKSISSTPLTRTPGPEIAPVTRAPAVPGSYRRLYTLTIWIIIGQAALFVLLTLLIWRLIKHPLAPQIRGLENRFDNLGNGVRETKDLFIKSSTDSENAIIDLKDSLAESIAGLRERFRDLAARIPAPLPEELELREATAIMKSFADGLWEIRRLLFDPSTNQLRSTFTNDDGRDIHNSLTSLFGELEMQKFWIQDKRGLTFEINDVDVENREVRNDLSQPTILYTLKPEILWKGAQLARAKVRIGVPDSRRRSASL